MSTTIETILNEAKGQIRELDAQAAVSYIADVDPFVIDVREAAELINGFLPKSDNIPRGVLEFKIASHQEVANKERPILVYCQTGMRGALATNVLNQLGYTQAVNLLGGFEQWQASNLPINKDVDAW